MRNKYITLTAIGALLIASGCKTQQERIAELNSEYNAADAQYKKDCFDPSKSGGDAGLKAAFGNGLTAEQAAALTRLQQAQQARIDSPLCKAEDAKRKVMADKLMRAMANAH